MWFRNLRKYGLDEIIANDEYELINMIEAAIEGGEQKFNGRNKIIKRFCGPLDGKSGLRIFEFMNGKIQKIVVL
jgi:hypothetical protein